MTTKDELESKHIAELHELAADAGVERYRMLRREELIAKLLESPDGGVEDEAGPARGKVKADEREEEGGREGPPGSRRRRRRRRGRRDSAEAEEKGARVEPGERGDPGRGRPSPEADRVSGPVEILPDGGAVVRGAEREAQLSAAQVKRCGLRTGEVVEGPVQSGRRGGEGLSMTRVESVNGGDPEAERGPEFESLTPVTPTRRIRLEIQPDDVLTRAAEILAPLAFGQRVLVHAEPRSGRSTLLRGIAKAIDASPDEAPVSVLLIDERPEEVTRWREEAPGVELHAASADMHPRDQVRLAELALARAKQRAERGEDAILFIDSLTRLAVAFDDPFAVKRFFGAGRELAEPDAGSLTVIAVAMTTGEQGAAVTRAVATTESTSLELSAKLAAEGVVPALVASRPSVAGEELIREEDELRAARKLRAELRLMPVDEAARTLAERISSTSSNAELLR